MKTLASLIIPTHNRIDVLLKNLAILGKQTYPASLMEVIVVADGCVDGTIEKLAELNTPFRLITAGQASQGPAAARNRGAGLASGQILIFLDDDIETVPGFVEAHVQAHTGQQNRVVIGYLNTVVTGKNRFFCNRVREWWESNFDMLRQPSHRWNYRNLTSGNFSVSRELFEAVNGFSSVFTCQEDYELGLRLILAGGQFSFSAEAAGHHHEAADPVKSFRRKEGEGKAAVLFARHYPALLPDVLRILEGKQPLKRKILIKLFLQFPAAARLYGQYLMGRLNLMETLNRKEPARYHFAKKLYDFHFLKGMIEEAGSVEALKKSASTTTYIAKEKPAVIDLKNGLAEAEQMIDALRPTSIHLVFGKHEIGSLPDKFGYEPWKSGHLRAALAAEQFKWKMMQAVALDQCMEIKGKPAKALGTTINDSSYAYTGA